MRLAVSKKWQKEKASQKEIKVKGEIWTFIEEFTKLVVIELLEWDWESPDFNLFQKCYNRTLSK